MLDSLPQSHVANNFEIWGGKVVWNLNFRRNVVDSEYEEEVKLLSLLYLTFASIGRDDDRLWSLDPKGCFSVQSCYNVLIGVNLHG